MIRFIILLFFISTTSLLSVSGNTIKCEYSETTSHGYGCVVTSLEDSFVKNTAGRHLRGYSNKDVEYFEATSKNLQFLPKNIDKIFPNLKAIKLNFNSLTELSHEDLKPFGEKLTFLSIVNSAIDVIPSDLFKSTPYISYMYLESPYLKSIENGAFDRLFYLNGFFARFGCFSDDAIDRDDVEKLIRSLSIRCHKKEVRFQNKPRPVAQAPPKAQTIPKSVTQYSSTNTNQYYPDSRPIYPISSNEPWYEKQSSYSYPSTTDNWQSRKQNSRSNNRDSQSYNSNQMSTQQNWPSNIQNSASNNRNLHNQNSYLNNHISSLNSHNSHSKNPQNQKSFLHDQIPQTNIQNFNNQISSTRSSTSPSPIAGTQRMYNNQNNRNKNYNNNNNNKRRYPVYSRSTTTTPAPKFECVCPPVNNPNNYHNIQGNRQYNTPPPYPTAVPSFYSNNHYNHRQ